MWRRYSGPCSGPIEQRYKYIDLPLSNYASASYDQVLIGGKLAGLSMFSGYSYNEGSMLSLGIVEHDVEIGTEVTWFGAKKAVERRKPPSSATSRRKSAPWSAPCRTPKPPGKSTHRLENRGC